ncbi:hypothetical protein [Calothrix sp. NIES-2098]|uniref:hypothetical protein n=1 Tax=Calothrix sp. NIES-2098 TaxID=1954171 RepID=UPI0030D75697
MSDRAALEPLQALLNDEQEVVRVLAKLAIAPHEIQLQAALHEFAVSLFCFESI